MKQEGREGQDGMRLRPCQRPQAQRAQRARRHQRAGVGPRENGNEVGRVGLVGLVGLLVVGLLAASAADDTARVRAWRTQHERQILGELFEFLSLPNVAAEKADVQRNAEALVAMFAKRRFSAEICPDRRRAPGIRRAKGRERAWDGRLLFSLRRAARRAQRMDL